MVQVWHDGENVGMSNELFAKYKGIDASYEIDRRNMEARKSEVA